MRKTKTVKLIKEKKSKLTDKEKLLNQKCKAYFQLASRRYRIGKKNGQYFILEKQKSKQVNK